MTWSRLILRSLAFHARSHLGVLLGAVVGSAILTGALLVGDSVRESLRQFALARLGSIQFALDAGDRYFRAELAGEIGEETKLSTVALLREQGIAARADGTAQANRVQILGIGPDFWKMAGVASPMGSPEPDTVLLNARLAEQLKVKTGDTLVFRLPKPSLLSRDAPVSPQEDLSVALRLKVQGIVPSTELGNFSLQANQVPPYNAFVHLGRLQELLEMTNRANALLVANDPASALTVTNLAAALRERWRLADAQLQLRAIPEFQTLELRSPRVFIDEPAARALVQVEPEAQGVLTYLVNELRLGDRATPYSMVTAMGAPIVPQEMNDQEIILNTWLAEDLGARVGDSIRLTYYVVGTMRQLEERQSAFRVRAVIPMEGMAADPSLMPDFPGLSDAENCRDWDAGFPIKMDRIRPKDENYWDRYKGVPKAFITLAAGQRLWGNRFGNLTAMRFPAQGASVDQVEFRMLQALAPSAAGLHFQPVRALALAASSQSQDFGQLFLGFSFFLILAALLLMALLFQLGMEQRSGEAGILLALGFTPQQVRRLFLGEGLVLALLGGLAGALAGQFYAKAMLRGLSTIWRDAVGTSALAYYGQPATLIIGALAGTVVAFLVIAISSRRQARKAPHELLSPGAESSVGVAPGPGWARGTRPLLGGMISSLLGVSLLGFGAMQSQSSPSIFFGAGALFLLAGLGFAASLVTSLAYAESGSGLTRLSLALRGISRRRFRSLTTIALLACGSFLIVAVGINRLEPAADWSRRASGTGGFALMGETALPVYQDLNSEAGKAFYGLDDLTNITFVPMRLRQGDDASCLNLNRAQVPRLLGVRPEMLAQRGAFRFARGPRSQEPPWLSLRRDPSDDAVPAIGDQASIQWALGKKVGDIIEYTDERGRTFPVRLVGSLANSILQGYLLIDEAEFVARFPSESGYRMFLIDAPSNQAAQEASALLTRAMRDAGMELTSTTRRLEALNAVQNTYLSTFQVLGGLGLILGSAGLGVVVLRNVFERRGELAVFLALGFRSGLLKRLVFGEHCALLLAGASIGLVAAAIAVLPVLMTPGGSLPYASLGLTLGAMLANGLLWAWLATAWALRGPLLDSLRNQ